MSSAFDMSGFDMQIETMEGEQPPEVNRRGARLLEQEHRGYKSTSHVLDLQVTTPPRRRNFVPRTHGSSGSPHGGLELHSPSSLYTSSPGVTHENGGTIYSDRHIPSRLASKLDEALDQNGDIDEPSDVPHHRRLQSQPQSDVARENQGIMNSLLRSELLGTSLLYTPKAYEPVDLASHPGPGLPGQPSTANVFRYSTATATSLSSSSGLSTSTESSFGPASPAASSRLALSPNKKVRRIPRAPYKVLDAPALHDDYYLNLVDWSSTNYLSVALGSSVYLWSACTSKVTKLCDVAEGGGGDSVTSICWATRGTHIAVGTNLGKVQIWDVHRGERVRDMGHHSSRVGTMAWSSTLLATGSRDRSIFLQDLRVRSSGSSSGSGSGAGAGGSTVAGGGGGDWSISPAGGEPCVVRELQAHKQEVCGLKWSPDEKMLASGGNDNKLFVWSLSHGDDSSPLCRFVDHSAAVKAVAWSPHQHGLLASGGGTADRNIRFWNALSGVALHRIDTGSQVCNLAWSKNVNEMVSTHGYSLNQIIVWKYPSMQKIATLTGHSLRVLYLAMSPDGQSIVTGAGDETLRFWSIFPGARNAQSRSVGLLLPGNDIR